MDSSVIDVECVIIAALGVPFALALLLRLLRRRRPEFAVGTPFAIGFVLRIVVITVVSVTSFGASLRGADEHGYLAAAHHIAGLSWTSGQWLPTNHISYLHVLVFAAQLRILGSPEGAMRITQIGISLAGALLIAAAVYDIAGARAARLAAWLLSLEVASLLFNGLLLKEPLMEFASGLVVFGGTKVWSRLDLSGIAIMGLGGLVALGTRQYVGWFLIAGIVALILHASLRQLGSLRALSLIYAVVAVVLVATPLVVQLSSHKALENLQRTQLASTSATAGNGSANGNNLALEKVNYASRSDLLTSLPTRVRDVLLRPYPWQTANVSQTFGVLGSLVALTCFFLLIRFAVLARGNVFRRTAPLFYPFLFLLVAYAYSVGNAGTGFRYRTHLVTIALAALVILRAHVLERRAQMHDPSRHASGAGGDRTLLASPRDRAQGRVAPAF
jgi:hypothetical protein